MIDIALGLLLVSVALQAFTIKVFLSKIEKLENKYNKLLSSTQSKNDKHFYTYIEGTMDFTYQGKQAKGIKAIIYPQKML